MWLNEFTKKWKFIHYLLTPMQMERREEFCWLQNIFGASQGNGVAESSFKDWKKKNPKTKQKWNKMAPHSFSRMLQVSKDTKLIWKENIYTPLKAEIFTVVAKLKALACLPHITCVKNLFSNECGILCFSGDPRSAVWSHFMICFFTFKNKSPSTSVVEENAATLWSSKNASWSTKTSRGLRAWGWADYT